MNALILLAQAFFNHQTQTQTEQLKQAGHRAAEMGRRMAIAAVFFAVAGAFFFAGLLISVIDLGLQIDRGHGVVFSGLMISSVIVFAIGLFSVFAGWLCSRNPKAVAPPVPVTPPASELRTMLEAIAVGLLKEFLEAQKAKQAANSAVRAETAPHDAV